MNKDNAHSTAHDMELDEKLESVPSGADSNEVTSSAVQDAPPRVPNSPESRLPQRPASSKTADDFTTKLFQFLSTATPGTLGSVAVGLAAVTYFVLGQVGLLLIGAFGGVVLYVQWESSNPDYVRAVHGETGLDVLARLLGEKAAARELAPDKDTDDDDEQFAIQSFVDFQPETQGALKELVDAVIRDYVNWWYDPIVPSDRSFPLSCRKVLTSFILSVSNHLGRKRPADCFLDFLTNTSSIVIVFFAELSNAFAELPPDSGLSAPDAVYNYLASNPESNLSNLLSQRQQASKFKAVAEDLLGFLERQTYDCDPARVFLREILAGVILEKSLQTCSSADWINGWIVYLLEAGEPDFNQAIDVGMQTGPEANSSVFADMDGNVGNIGLAKSNRNSFESEKPRRKESAQVHKKKLSKADEEMENALEEMKRLNQMIADDKTRRKSKELKRSEEPDSSATERLANAIQRNANELEIQAKAPSQATPITTGASSPAISDLLSPTQAPSSESRSGKEGANDSLATTTTASASQTSSPQAKNVGSFTNFDQLGIPAQDDADLSDSEPRKPPPLTLHNATVTIYDDGASDKGRIRTKPSWDYLIQIEPSSSHYPGWMIVRQYADFEKLHEVLRRIATISGITAFAEQHTVLPSWKVHTRESLRGELERYVRDACWYKPLAESEGMKRFLDKDQGHSRTESKSGFQAIENMGKNMFGVLASAPKGVAEGGKMLAGGVTGVFGNIGLGPRKTTPTSLPEATASGRGSQLSISTPPRMDGGLPSNGTLKTRDSMDSQRSSVVSTQPGKNPPMERRPSYQSQGEPEDDGHHPTRPDRWDGPSPSAKSSRANSRASSMAALRSPIRSPSTLSLEALKLPPPPDEIPDDYGSPVSPEASSRTHERNLSQQASFHSAASALSLNKQGKKVNGGADPARRKRKFSKLSEQETHVAVELVFAIINELYTLSSAWNFRRTLLAAAKSFLLRPGNPSLVSIRKMIEDSVIEANTSDSGIAAHLRKLRENTLPTEEELKAWPPELTPEEKEKLRVKARNLLIQSGVPAALSGVMGQNATTEALGRIFDCLQIEEVARGLIFGIILQAVRIITH